MPFVEVDPKDLPANIQQQINPGPQLSLQDLHGIATAAAEHYGLDPTIFTKQIQQESGFNPKAMSNAGAVGIAQIVPKFHPGVDPHDPVASLDYAAKYMSGLVHQYGNYPQALSVYNSGNPNAYLNPKFAKGQTYNYVRDILGNQNTNDISAKQSPANKTPYYTLNPGAPDKTGMLPLPSGITHFSQSLQNPPQYNSYSQEQQKIQQVLDQAKKESQPLTQDQVDQQLQTNGVDTRSPEQIAQADLQQHPLNLTQPVAPANNGNLLTNAWHSIEGIPGAVANAYQQEYGKSKAFNPLEFQGGLLSGALADTANMGNAVLGLPAAIGNFIQPNAHYKPLIQIPIDPRLQAYREAHPFSGGVGGLLPWVLGGAATEGIVNPTEEAATQAPKFLPGLAKGMATNAGLGFVSTPGSVGQRVQGATDMAALGGVLHTIPATGRLFFREHPEAPTMPVTQQDISGGPMPTVNDLTNTNGMNPNIGYNSNPESRAAFDQARDADIAAQQTSLKPAHEFSLAPKKQLILPEEQLPPGIKPGEPISETNPNLILGTPETTPRVDRSGELVRGSALPQGRDLNPTAPDILPETKSAQESAQAFQSHAEDVATAQQMADEATAARIKAEQELINNTPAQSLQDAQRLNGMKILELQNAMENGGLNDAQGSELMQRQSLLKQLQDARENEAQANQLLQETQAVTPRSSLPIENDIRPRLPEVNNDLRSSLEIQKENPDTGTLAESRVGRLSPESNRDNVPKPELAPARDIAPTKSLLASGHELGPQPDLSRESNPKVLEFPGKQSGPIQIFGPNGKPISEYTPPTSTTKSAPFQTPVDNGTVFTRGLSQEQAAKAISDLQASLAKHHRILIDQAEAERLLNRTGRQEELQHTKNFIQNAIMGNQHDMAYAPLKEGGQVVHERGVNPLAVATHHISPTTELANLKKQFSPTGDGTGYDAEAVRNNLINRLQKYGNVNANSLGKVSMTDLVKRLDKASKGDELTHVYHYAHNFGDTTELNAEGTVRSYRASQVKDSSLTGRPQEIPATEQYQNQIKPAYDYWNKVAQDPTMPKEVQRAIRQVFSGKITKNTIPSLQALFDKMDSDKIREIMENC